MVDHMEAYASSGCEPTKSMWVGTHVMVVDVRSYLFCGLAVHAAAGPAVPPPTSPVGSPSSTRCAGCLPASAPLVAQERPCWRAATRRSGSAGWAAYWPALVAGGVSVVWVEHPILKFGSMARVSERSWANAPGQLPQQLRPLSLTTTFPCCTFPCCVVLCFPVVGYLSLELLWVVWCGVPLQGNMNWSTPGSTPALLQHVVFVLVCFVGWVPPLR